MNEIVEAETFDEEIVEVSNQPTQALVNYVPEIRRTPAQVKEAIESVEGLVRDHMREGIDFGTIPGTPKPTLYKAGAERLARFFGLGSIVEQTGKIEDWDNDFVMYDYRVGIGPITPDGVVPIAWCEGSANSKEKKYARTIAKTSLYDIVNTLKKMAQKRAYVGAVLMATNTSDFFTQDLEDLPKDFVQGGQEVSLSGSGTKPTPAPVPSSGGSGQTTLNFGKYKGMTLAQIVEADRTYLQWLIEQFEAKVDSGEELAPEKIQLANNIMEVLS